MTIARARQLSFRAVSGILISMLALVAIAPAAAQTLQWTQRTVTGPSPRDCHAMSYDSARGVTVLFGGFLGSSVSSGQTWEWNGTTWTLRATTGPEPRGDVSMAYDPVRHVTVLFGGHGGTTGNTFFYDTWEWNGSTWTRRAVSTMPRPPGSWSGAMAYDPVRGVMVHYGGVITLGTPDFSSETWEWNGSAWTRRSINSPGWREEHGLAYDTARGTLVLFGGIGLAAGPPFPLIASTYELTGTAWTPRPTSSGPSARWQHSMAYDSRRGVTMLFGGYMGYSDADTDGETWEWDGTAWTQHLVGGPSPRSQHGMAYDSGRGVMVLFGGFTTPPFALNGETWELRTICPADFNADGIRDPDDLADFITCFFLDVQFPGTCPDADFNGDTFRDPDDLADFITAFFTGC